ncbi:hypothetical protein [Rufibacter psychrotolerans]|uniref:hypothetical protein n=1 Tax=Rufibacter psychrotolerans TaxID=2812556 RepID=UPI0019681809|nr:hypothetical protein [Rufibacter sp. SYSU D00308]
MKTKSVLLPFLLIAWLSTTTAAQTNKDIQGTWRLISTTIKLADGGETRLDSATHNLTKTITQNRIIFTLYDKKTNSLLITGQGKASTKGNQYTEHFEQASDRSLVGEPMVFTYKVQGNKLSYEGGKKGLQILEVLQRIE